MKRELAEQFNQEVDSYRRALLYCAKKCDWEAFKTKAGRLFDYLESVEFRELERRFFRTFNFILGVLILALIGFFNVDFEVHQEWTRMKNVFLLSALAASSYELFFYVNYRRYMNFKSSYSKKRREIFIKDIESDFRNYALRPEGSRA